MVIGFIIWALAAAAAAGFGFRARRAGEPMGFFAGVKPPKVKDTAAYNRAVARLWFVFGGLFLLMGVPLLFAGENKLLLLLPLLGVPLLCILLAAGYTVVEGKHRE